MAKDTETKMFTATVAIPENPYDFQSAGMDKAIPVDFSKLSPEIIGQLAMAGLYKTLANVNAGATKAGLTAEQRTEAAAKKLASLEAGEWTVRRAGGGGASRTADPMERALRASALTYTRKVVKQLLAEGESVPAKHNELFALEVEHKGKKITVQSIFEKAKEMPAIVDAAKAQVAAWEAEESAIDGLLDAAS